MLKKYLVNVQIMNLFGVITSVFPVIYQNILISHHHNAQAVPATCFIVKSIKDVLNVLPMFHILMDISVQVVQNSRFITMNQNNVKIVLEVNNLTQKPRSVNAHNWSLIGMEINVLFVIIHYSSMKKRQNASHVQISKFMTFMIKNVFPVRISYHYLMVKSVQHVQQLNILVQQQRSVKNVLIIGSGIMIKSNVDVLNIVHFGLVLNV